MGEHLNIIVTPKSPYIDKITHYNYLVSTKMIDLYLFILPSGTFSFTCRETIDDPLFLLLTKHFNNYLSSNLITSFSKKPLRLGMIFITISLMRTETERLKDLSWSLSSEEEDLDLNWEPLPSCLICFHQGMLTAPQREPD